MSTIAELVSREIKFSEEDNPALIPLRQLPLELWFTLIFPRLTGPDILNLAVSRVLPAITDIVCSLDQESEHLPRIWERKIQAEFPRERQRQSDNNTRAYHELSGYAYGYKYCAGPSGGEFRRVRAACAIGDWDRARYIANNAPFYLSTRSPFCDTSPFDLACFNGHIGIVEALLNKLNFKGNHESFCRALDYAILGRQVEVTEKLIAAFYSKRLAQPFRDHSGNKLIRTAIQAGFHKGLQLLLSLFQGNNIPHLEEEQREDLFCEAFRVKENPDIIQTLIDLGAATSRAAGKALYYLLSGPDLENPARLFTLQALGADLFAYPANQDFGLEPPLFTAAHSGKLEYAKIILNAGANPGVALLFAIRNNKGENRLQGLQDLLTFDVDLNTPYEWPRGHELPLVHAIRNDHHAESSYTFLVHAGASEADVLHQTGLSVFEHAVHFRNASVLRTLLSQNPESVRVLETDPREMSLAHQTILTKRDLMAVGNPVEIEILIEAGSRLDSRVRGSASHGDSLLHSVAKCPEMSNEYQIYLIKLLLRRGANPFVRNLKFQRYCDLTEKNMKALHDHNGYWGRITKPQLKRYHQSYQQFVTAYNAFDIHALRQIQFADPIAYQEFVADVLTRKLHGCENTTEHANWFTAVNVPFYNVRDCTVGQLLEWMENYISLLKDKFNYKNKVSDLEMAIQAVKNVYPLQTHVNDAVLLKFLQTGKPSVMSCIQRTRTTGKIARGWGDFMRTFTTYDAVVQEADEELELEHPNKSCH